MESIDFRQGQSGLEIVGIPDARHVVKLTSKVAKRLADLALHRADLDFAKQCLDAINAAPEVPRVTREALWRSAIVHFLKCFGNGARFQLSAHQVLKGEAPEAMIAFNYFKALRNKHLVHDENSHSQSIPGAVINDGTKAYKVEKIVCFATSAITLEQENYSNLSLLIAKVSAWTTTEFDALCSSLTTELERLSLEQLLRYPPMKYQVPTPDEVDQSR